MSPDEVGKGCKVKGYGILNDAGDSQSETLLSRCAETSELVAVCCCKAVKPSMAYDERPQEAEICLVRRITRHYRVYT